VDQVAVILPGAGSSSGFVTRVFAGPLREAGYALVAPPPAPGPELVARAVDALDTALDTYGSRLRLVGGISLGAHVAARWAYGRPAGSAGLLLALPAWTGPPGAVAAATAAAAESVELLGTAGALAAAGEAVGWVAAELAAAWPGYGSRLAASLRAAAPAPGPTRAELAGLTVPAGIVAFTDDPLHPATVAREWAATAPQAALRELPVTAPATDRTVLARAALAALAEAARPADPAP
jgi:pimeloyl-ACP methyl ester carboxylesterase